MESTTKELQISKCISYHGKPETLQHSLGIVLAKRPKGALVAIGALMQSDKVGTVLVSKDRNFSEGDIVKGPTGRMNFVCLKASLLRKRFGKRSVAIMEGLQNDLEATFTK